MKSQFQEEPGITGDCLNVSVKQHFSLKQYIYFCKHYPQNQPSVLVSWVKYLQVHPTTSIYIQRFKKTEVLEVVYLQNKRIIVKRNTTFSKSREWGARLEVSKCGSASNACFHPPQGACNHHCSSKPSAEGDHHLVVTLGLIQQSTPACAGISEHKRSRGKPAGLFTCLTS